jgi:hypothetical protein
VLLLDAGEGTLSFPCRPPWGRPPSWRSSLLSSAGTRFWLPSRSSRWGTSLSPILQGAVQSIKKDWFCLVWILVALFTANHWQFILPRFRLVWVKSHTFF